MDNYLIPTVTHLTDGYWIDSSLVSTPRTDFECWFSPHPCLPSSFSFLAIEGSHDATVATEHRVRKKKKKKEAQMHYYYQFSYLLAKAWNFKTIQGKKD